MTELRKDLRLRNWDYSSNSCYHIIFCVQGRRCALGSVERLPDGSYETRLSDIGKCITKAIEQALIQYSDVSVDIFAIMPNHVHMLVSIRNVDDSRTLLGRFVSFVKSGATRSARALVPGLVLWQRGYYDHIIRDDEDYFRVWEYIENNPANWANDEYYSG